MPGEACTISITYTAKKGGVSEGVLVVVANSTPASEQVRLVVTDQPGSPRAQKSVRKLIRWERGFVRLGADEDVAMTVKKCYLKGDRGGIT